MRLLARVAGLSHRLEALLRELQALEMIYEQGHVPEPAYIFKHAVIQDVAYQSLLMQRRKGLHRAVGEAIEDLYQDRLEEHAAELAYHFVRGEVWEKALAYSRQAGEQALAQSAHREAVGSFEQALSALPVLLPIFVSRLQLCICAGRDATQRPARCWTRRGPRWPPCRSEVSAFQALVSVWSGHACLLTGRLDDSYALATQAHALSQAHQGRGHEAWALHLLGDVAMHHQPPESEPAAVHYRQAGAQAEELGSRPLRPTPPGPRHALCHSRPAEAGTRRIVDGC